PCFFLSSRRRHTSFSRDWSSDVCSSDLREGSTTASLAENDFHKVMVEAAERCRLRFIANVVVDSRNEPIDLVAGHWLKAWEEGVRLCEQGSLVPIDKLADLVIVSPGGFPKDINMYQAQKIG